MTSIEQIQISGVRSFDPNPAHRQTIVFQKPLTVILGKNGAGKTTIIEALLNACTGQMPPGSGSEKSSFVYDPKVMGETDVKAQIRLLFTGRGGKVMQVIRSFQALRTRTKTTFTTLDSTVAFQDTATGKVLSSTYRANDVDRAVPEMLGVSPAVLEHVIFCHQEDANWPLLPPKEVKKIFDEIFAATRYVLALDRLRENSKEFRRQQKEHEANLMALREHREQAQQLTGDIAAKEELVRTIQQRSKSLEPQLKELHAVTAALSAVEQGAEGLAREAAMIQGRIDEKQESLSRMTLPPTTLTIEEMLEFKQGFAERIKGLEADASDKANLLEKAEAKKQQCEETALRLRSTTEFLEQQERQYKENRVELQGIVKNLSTGLVLCDDDMCEEDLQRVSDHLNAELQLARAERDKALKEFDDEKKLLEDQRNMLLRSMDADNKEKDMKEDQLKHLHQRVVSTEEALGKLKPYVGATYLESLKKTISELEQRLEVMEELKKKGENYKQRQDILQRIDAQNRIVAGLRQELARHKECLGGEAEMNLLRTQITEKERFLEAEMRETLVPELSNFGHEMTEGSSLSQISLLIEQLREQKLGVLRAIQTEHGELDRQIAVLQQNRAQRMEEIMRENSELQRKRTNCVKALDGLGEIDHFEAVLEKARDLLEAARNRHHALEAMSTCYANFVQVARVEGKCPVCDRGFTDELSLANFVELNERHHGASPEMIEKAHLEAKEAEERVRILETLEADVHDVRRLASSVPHLELLVTRTNEELANKSALLEDAERKREDVEHQLKRVQDLMRTAIDLNAVACDVRALRQQLSRREAAIKELQAEVVTAAGGGADGGARTYEEVSAEYESANTELHRLNVMLNEAQRREDGESDQAAASELNARRAEYYQLEMKWMRQGELEEVLARYKGEENGYRERIAAINAGQEGVREELLRLQSRIDTLQRARQDAECAAQQGRIGKIEESTQMLAGIVPKMRDYFASKHGEQLFRAREQMQLAEASRLRAVDEVRQLREAIQESRRVVDEQHRQAVEVGKHIEAFKKRQSIDEDQARLQEVERSLTEMKSREIRGVAAILGADVIAGETVSRIRELIREKVSELERSRAQQEGNVEAMMQDITNLRSQLAREKYHDIEKRYRSTFLKVQTTEIAVADIEKYYRALEKAVQSYHQEKIAQINQILADLWRQTYKGSDIDTVELRSEDDVTSTTARRSYSYRVVMKRGNSEMDMRGRCSAGQKVLASVLIRLALSEAFCCDCGILALDEPTTNLDEDNARSLAESLRLLIENHRAVKHFQLIVITHDEQFVRALGGQALDTFYYIRKDRDGAFSVIEERTFDQLFAA
ncbi:DNA repair protein RAD50, putative [Trypanosoma cruzi]|uniref:DNA repair protein RAD50 n=1 Tax=Trypanosoma cruzi (strain CL Brener) TaxID=353153 RepID=Q4DKE4_TRYCC|nr:DNA repair protein RAD50, putative [Trypanosoma cruzi]EAN92994.1 DNA repair protein RAD50, putative [Trypanosoma cruzi]|eukprot:XP_814845.1 DNA repair protein RAD50 [Trypanosoma cruzi strain CL Brener]